MKEGSGSLRILKFFETPQVNRVLGKIPTDLVRTKPKILQFGDGTGLFVPFSK